MCIGYFKCEIMKLCILLTSMSLGLYVEQETSFFITEWCCVFTEQTHLGTHLLQLYNTT